MVKNGKILIVDKDRNTTSEILNSFLLFGYNPFIANTKEDAMSKLRSTFFNIIFIDESILSEDPVSIIESIKTLANNVPFVITLSSFQDKLIRSIDKTENNIVDIIRKPYSIDKLIFLIESLLTRTEQVSVNKQKNILTKKEREEIRKKKYEILIKERLAKLVVGNDNE